MPNDIEAINIHISDLEGVVPRFYDSSENKQVSFDDSVSDHDDNSPLFFPLNSPENENFGADLIGTDRCEDDKNPPLNSIYTQMKKL